MSLLKGRAPSLTAVVLVCAAFATTGAQRRDKGEKVDKIDQAQRQDAQLLAKTVDGAMSGQAPASEIPIGWISHFLKGREHTSYVPYVLTIEPGKLAAASLALYLRAVPKETTTAALTDGQSARKDDKKIQKDAESVYPFEDFHIVDLRTPPSGQPHRVSRALAVPPGEYDVYVAVRERASATAAAKAPAPAAPKMGLVKQALTVPDFWNGELTTSSIILVDRMEPLGAPIPSEQQAEHPYALGTAEVTPALDTQFKKSEELSVIFYIYNPALDANKKPNLLVEYGFQKTDKSGPLRKTPPQEFNGQTLPPQFDLAAGHQIGAGQAVPLASFSEGEYRLEIVVKDNTSGKSITRELTFTVAP